MSFRPSHGNMYTFVTHTYNAIKGRCPHDCKYCYMKIFELKDPRLDKRALEINLGEGNFIFVGSSIDMFAYQIPEDWIIKTLDHCLKFKNKYLFQSKNPKRMFEMEKYIPVNSVIGTTIETNRYFPNIMNYAPLILERAEYMEKIAKIGNFETMVTIEPVLDFDLEKLVNLIYQCRPSWVNVGADSKGHGLPEPTKEKILKLIKELKKFTEVKEKRNLRRIMGGW